MQTKLPNLTVKELMHSNWTYLSPTMRLNEALTTLISTNQTATAVVDETKQLLGFITEQDILRGLWSDEYVTDSQLTVNDLMKLDLITVCQNQTIDEMAELFSVDKSKLFNVNDTGMLISMSYQSYEERLRYADSQLPSILPVVDNGKVIGIMTQNAIAKYLVS